MSMMGRTPPPKMDTPNEMENPGGDGLGNNDVIQPEGASGGDHTLGGDHTVGGAIPKQPKLQRTPEKSQKTAKSVVGSKKSQSTTLSKLEAARLANIEKQEKLLQEKAKKDKELLEARRVAELERLEQEEEAKRLQMELESAAKRRKLQQDAELAKLEAEKKEMEELVNLSQEKQKILEERSNRSKGSSILSIPSQPSKEKVKDWMASQEFSKRENPLESTPKDEEDPFFLKFNPPRMQKIPFKLERHSLSTSAKPEVPVKPPPKNPQKFNYEPLFINKNRPPIDKEDYKDIYLKYTTKQNSVDPNPQPNHAMHDSKPCNPSNNLNSQVEKLIQGLAQIMDIKGAESHEASRNMAREAEFNQSFMRQAVYKDLVKFDGNPLDYPLFIGQFKNSNETARFSDAENLTRLQRCLVDRSPAREAVKDLLNYPHNVPEILKRLEMMFGKPEHIVAEIRSHIESFPSIPEKNMGQIVEFSTIVANLSATLTGNKDEANLKNPDLLRLIVKKLPPSVQFDWVKFIATQKDITIKDLSEWLSPISDALLTLMDRSVYYSWKKPGTSKDSHSKSVNVHLETPRSPKEFEPEDKKDFKTASNSPPRTSKDQKGKGKSCSCCGKDKHYLTVCQKFKSLNYGQKWRFVKRIKVCYRCLKPGHRPTNCDEDVCGLEGCQKNHHKLLHFKPDEKRDSDGEKKGEKKDEKKGEKKDEKKEEKKGEAQPNCHASSKNNVLYKILPVLLHAKGNTIKTYAFIDEGSAVSLIDSSLVEELSLNGTPDPLCLSWTDGSVRTEPDSQRLSLKISGNWDGSRHYQVDNIRSVKSLELPSQSLSAFDLGHKSFENLPIEPLQNAVPRLMLGLEHYKLGLPLDVVEGSTNGPSAFKSRLGWYLFGRGTSEGSSQNYNLHVAICPAEEDLHQMVKSFFTTENFGVAPPTKDILSDSEKRALKIFDETTLKTELEERYKTGLFWRFDKPILANSLEMTKNRFLSLEKKFQRDVEYAKVYRTKMSEYFDKGYARVLSLAECEDKAKRIWYLPHFGVTNPNKPNKLRIVFDAAAKVGDQSLNSMLLTGPDTYASLVGVLYKFRERAVGVVGDIKEMFNRVIIREEDQHVQRFLWRVKEEGEVQHCVFTAMLFGATCSPAIAQLVKNRNAEKFLETHSKAVDAIIHRHYVDDYLDSFDTEEEAVKVASDVKWVHARAGFELRNFVSNSAKVTATLNDQKSVDIMVNMDLESTNATDKVLGMFWRLDKDVFVFKRNGRKVPLDVANGSRKMTKREFLRVTMSLFDPMGLLGHLVVQAKIILQNIWRSGISWDEELKDDDFADWLNWWNMASYIEALEIPRCYMKCSNQLNVQLHVFVDASEQAFSAVAFWRFENNSGVQLSLIGSKTKVAPIKLLSIPRLELQAAVLGKRFADMILKEHTLKPAKRIFWSDSRTVLNWLRADHRRFKQFVAFRISEILDGSEVNEWYWVPTKENVADIATKQNKELVVENDQRWFKGPEFLHQPPETWPMEPIQEPVVEPAEELRPVHHMNVENRGFSVIDDSRFSTWSKLQRTTARVLKSKEFFKTPRPRKFEDFVRAIVTNPKLEDTLRAKQFLIQKAQWESFAKDIKVLENGGIVDKASDLKSLNPYLEDGILHMGGRIDALSAAPRSMKRPIILPKNHHITALIIDSFHRRFLHSSDETVVNELRQEFWIPHLRVTVRKIRMSCQVCKNRRLKPSTAQMGPLPSARLSPYFRPFTYSGLDYFGPVEVVIGRRREKRWVALFTCLTIRAVHLEIVRSLSADSCILAIRNFINRRGCPLEIHSDNGTNFRGAKTELKKALAEIDQEKIADSLTMRGIHWITIPPYSPHKGGSWERMVRSVKSIVGKVLYSKALHEETLQSFLIEAENIINSRPLMYVPLESSLEEALTPNHFLHLSSNGLKERWDFQESLLRKQWKISQELANHFWTRWVKEYAPTILRRTKWVEDGKPLKVGDVVIILDPKAPRNDWAKGIILETIPSRDGKIRTVKIKTENGIKTRSIHNLALLDVKSKDL